MKTLQIEQVIDQRVAYFKDIDAYLAYCKATSIRPNINYNLPPRNWIGPKGQWYEFINQSTGTIERRISTNSDDYVNIGGIPKLQSLADYTAALKPSDAEYSIFPGSVYTIDSARILSLMLENQVDALCDEIFRDTNIIATSGPTIAWGVTWKSDPRRFYTINVKGSAYDAGYIFAMRHRFGINCPGKWSLTPDGPVFSPLEFKKEINNSIWDAPVKIPDGYEVVKETGLMGSNIIIREKVTNTPSDTTSLEEMVRYLYNRAKAQDKI
jgi:hypothetical protein